MPKRMIDGESLWLSDKIKALPDRFQPEFANILPLALADGAFECDPSKVWSKVYAYNRPKITLRFVRQMLDAFESVGLIARGTYDGHIWGYFKGIEKPGRLPKPSHRNRYETSNLPLSVIQNMRDQLPPVSRSYPATLRFGRGRKGVEGTRACTTKPLEPEIQKQEETPKPERVN